MNQERDDFDCSTVTELLVFAHAFLIGLFITFGVFFLIFTKIEASDFIFAGHLIAVSLLIIDVVWLCKLLIDFVHRNLKVGDLTKYRNDYLIAFGTIGIFTVVLRILAYFPELSKVQYYDTETRKDIIGTQFFLTFPSAIAFAEFAQVLLIGVRLTNVNGRRNEVAAQPVESRRAVNKISVKPEPKPTSKTAAPKPSCNICFFPYTETGIHTPRQIKECGHTICEQCANNLLSVKFQNLLVCPFCQKPTIVNGLAGALPKNFALLEYSRDVVQRN